MEILLEKKKKELHSLEIEILKTLKENTVKLNKAKGRERQRLLKEMKFLRDTLKFLYNKIHAEVRHAEQDKSITLTLKFVSAYHLKVFMASLNTLEQCLKADLKLLPTCQGYDLTDAAIQVTVAEDLYVECEANLKKSE